MKRLNLFAISLLLITSSAVTNAQNDNNNLLTNYNNALRFMQIEFSAKHPIMGWPELRSDWFIRVTGENNDWLFYEISGFSIWNEYLIINIQKQSFIKKPDGIGSMYVLDKVKYLNVNVNDTIVLVGNTTGNISDKKQKNKRTDAYIKYNKYEIDHRGEESLQKEYKENKNYDADMVDLLYNHLLAIKVYRKSLHLNSDSILSNFKKEHHKSSSPLTISEDQRKFIVQANAANEEKDYKKATELFEKAIKINPYAYPSAYYNMALIAAQLGSYQNAIFNMNKYLILVPDAEDARAAQDKIYEWEMKSEIN